MGSENIEIGRRRAFKNSRPKTILYSVTKVC